MKYYVCHHLPLADRRVMLAKELSKHGIEPHWVTGYTPNDIVYPEKHRFINKGEMSTLLKHKFCYMDQIANGIEYATIFEDDVDIYYKEFRLNEKKFMREFIKMGCDMMFVGECCNIKPNNIEPNKHVYYHPSYRTRCTHYYIINLRAAKLILQKIDDNPITIDHFLNEIIETQGLRSCYTVPGIKALSSAPQAGVTGGIFKSALKK